MDVAKIVERPGAGYFKGMYVVEISGHLPYPFIELFFFIPLYETSQAEDVSFISHIEFFYFIAVGRKRLFHLLNVLLPFLFQEFFKKFSQFNLFPLRRHTSGEDSGCLFLKFRDRKSTRLNSSHSQISY